MIAGLFTIFVFVLSCCGAPLDQCDVSNNQRFDCYPGEGANQQRCQQRGCCWRPPSSSENINDDEIYNYSKLDIPYCFYGQGTFGYNVCGHLDTQTGFSLDLCMTGRGGPYGGNIEKLKADVFMETKYRVRIKIYDPSNKRYEVPVPTPILTKKASNTDYDVTYVESPFGIKVTRKSTNETIFNTALPTSGFIFSDQFLQISSMLPSSNVYGLGEHVMSLRLSTAWTQLTMFARDIATPEGGGNLYGTHPFYVNVEKDGNANGVFFKNSNAMDVILQPTPAITYKTIGGILDFYVFLGPTPDNVVSQLTDVVGRPVMPPYWALGFHLCRWGYNTSAHLREVYDRMISNEIPYDTQWNDIDYMDNHLDFTIDGKNFADLSNFSDMIHSKGMHYIVMVDPAISSTKQNYKPYEDGIDADIFIKDQNGNPLQGVVWPGNTVYPDFFHPNVSTYWDNQIRTFYQKIKFDGVWIDMNEPSNFVQGSLNGCPQSKYENPPYLPAIYGGVLKDKTICMTAQQYSDIHYNLHSLYGHSEAVITMRTMKKLLGKRSVVITRSSYTGTGHHAGHWLGDNHSKWSDLYRSIAGILNFNMFGIPFVGADICGFIGESDEELCQRWMQLGAFYPFMRNHNTIGTRDQDPAAFSNALIQTSKAALRDRYTMLPYLYTLHFDSFLNGKPVARPLFFSFPKDTNTLDIDTQFMWGNGLMISPVLQPGANNVSAYVPLGRWYEYYTGAIVDSRGEHFDLPAEFDKINLHVRGGTIIPTQEPAVTTTKSRTQPYGLVVALDENAEASGGLYLDDGEMLLDDRVQSTSYVFFSAGKKRIRNIIIRKGYTPNNTLLGNVIVFGVMYQPGTVIIGRRGGIDFSYDLKLKVLRFYAAINVMEETEIEWY